VKKAQRVLLLNCWNFKGVEELLATSEVGAGKHTQIRLMIDYIEVNYIVEETGEEVTVEASVPSGEIKLVHPFNVVEGETLTSTLDFDALSYSYRLRRSKCSACNNISYKLIFRSWKER
jgi:hypothetical protein